MDKRKNNGGNSTKAKGIDKRKNTYKTVVENIITADELVKVLKMLLNKAIKDKDIQASKIILEYSLGKAKEQIDVTTNGESLKPNQITFIKSED